MVSRGDVWWYEHPQLKRRPVVVLTRESALSVLNQVLGVPCTRTVRGIPTEVALDEDDGMPSPCVATLDNVQLVRPPLCVARITHLGPERMAEICRALHIAVGC